jgi:hypothetical protein
LIFPFNFEIKIKMESACSGMTAEKIRIALSETGGSNTIPTQPSP